MQNMMTCDSLAFKSSHVDKEGPKPDVQCNKNKDEATTEWLPPEVDDKWGVLEMAIAEFIVKVPIGPEVKPELATLINKHLTTMMDETKRKNLYDKHIRPHNCNLDFPQVNEFIWNYINYNGQCVPLL